MMKKKLLILLLLCTAHASFASDCADSDKRYQDNRDGSIIDKQSGLMWTKCPIGLSGAQCQRGQTQKHTWLAALDVATNFDFLNKQDWRLPSKNELMSLVDASCSPTLIDHSIFPDSDISIFWSSSKRRDDNLAQYVDFKDGLEYSKSRFQYYSVRLVRDVN